MNNKDFSGQNPSFMAGLEPLSRRGFLRAGALTGVAFTTGCARLLGRKEAPEALKYGHLSEDEVRTATRLTEILIPAEQHGFPSATGEVPTVKNLDDMVGQMAPQVRELLGLGFWVFERRPMVSFKFSRFSKLDDEEALAYVQAMQEGAFFERGLMTTLKTVITLNYWRDSRTWPGLDYWGPVTEKWGVTRLGNAPLPRA
jgi:hypothetical protein